MATDTAAPPAATDDPTRNLWQVPVFLAGVAAFVAAYFGWIPVGSPDPSTVFRRDLDALRAACNRVSPDPGELKTLLTKTAAAAETAPELAPAVHFALGTGWGKLAELTAPADEARGYWTLADQHFDRVKPEQLPDPADGPRLAFRAAKARVGAGLPANSTTAQLELFQKLLLTPPPNEDPGEASRFVAELALQTTPPDLKRAKTALVAYIAEVGLGTPPPSLSRAKLRLSEVCLLRKEPEEAREWLKKIPADAPADVLGPAKAQLARILMTDGNYPDAKKAWEQVRAAPVVDPKLRSLSAYYLGMCELGLKGNEAAAKVFAEASKSEGVEGPAAAVRLADLILRAADADTRRRAVPFLTAAVKGVGSSKDWNNPLVPVNEVQAAFEAAVQVLTTDGAFEAAAEAAGAYKAVAATGKDLEKRAEVQAAWGEALRKTKGEFKPKFAAAAAEYAALAEAQSAATARADLLRRAAALYRGAEDPAAALGLLEKAVKLPALPDDAAGPVCLDYADALLAANRPDDALEAFKKVMLTDGPWSTAARFKVAKELVESRDPKRVPFGLSLLGQIADKADVRAEEEEYREQAMAALAGEAVRVRNFAEAEVRARKQLNIYPAGAEAGLGRLLLGIALLQRAAGPPPAAAPDPATAARMRDEALKHFQAVVADVERKAAPTTAKLSERDEWLRLQAGMRVVQSYMQLAKGQDVLMSAEPLIQRYKGTTEELILLRMVYDAQQILLRTRAETAQATKDRMREVFDGLKAKPGAFPAESGEYSRAFWEKWFAPPKS